MEATTDISVSIVIDGEPTVRTFAPGDAVDVATLAPAQARRLIACGAIAEAAEDKE